MLWLEYNEENIDTTLLEKLVWANPGCVRVFQTGLGYATLSCTQ